MKPLLWLLLAAIAPSCWAAEPLVVYAYDSFAAGAGPKLVTAFERECGCQVRVVATGGAGQLLTRLEIDRRRGKPTAQVVLGLDAFAWARAGGLVVRDWGRWTPRGWAKIVPEARVGAGFVPIDWAPLTFIADARGLAARGLAAPRGLTDFAAPGWRRNLLLEDPRTSSPGLAFLMFTLDVFKDGVWDFWRAFRSRWLTLAPGWEGAYGLFLGGEAPLAWSFVTSQAYHAEHGDTLGRYRALALAEGAPAQVEGAALVQGAPGGEAQAALARRFLSFLLSPRAQSELARSNWMLPAVRGAAVPATFGALPRLEVVGAPVTASRIEGAIRGWERAVEGWGP